MVWPAIIAAGAKIGAGVLAARAQPSGPQGRSFALHQGDIEYARQNRAYQDRVADAEKAGLHPLFALGSSANYSPTSATPQYPRSGSYAGEGIAQAGADIAKGMRRSEELKVSNEIHGLRVEKMKREIALDDAELLRRASDLKMSEQQSLYWGDANAGITSTGSPEAKTYPFGTKVGPPLNMRPLSATGRMSIPLRAEMIADDGWRYRMLNPDANMDELAEADLVWQWTMRKTRQARLALPRNIQIWLGQYKAARARRRKQQERRR